MKWNWQGQAVGYVKDAVDGLQCSRLGSKGTQGEDLGTQMVHDGLNAFVSSGLPE